MAIGNRLITSAAAGALALGSLATFAAVPAAQAALPQGDGDLTAFVVDGNPDGPNDWDAPYGPGTTPQGNPTSGMLPNGGPFLNADFCGNGKENIMIPSTKLDDIVIDDLSASVDPNGQANEKADLCGGYLASELVEVGGEYHTVLYGAWTQQAEKRGEVRLYLPLADDVPGNSSGDRMVDFDYKDSDNTTAGFLRSWDGSAWVRGAALPQTIFEAKVNEAGTFGEFALDLTAAGVLPLGGPCRTVSVEGAFTETGQGNNPTLKDFVAVDDLQGLTNCATLVVEKVATPEPVDPTDFGFSVYQRDEGAVQGEHTSLAGTVQVPGSPATHPEVGNPVTVTDVLAAPDYAVEESSLPKGWTQQSLVCTGTDPLTGRAFTRTLYDPTAEELDNEFPLGPGRTVTCTITNLGPPAVQLTKSVLPEAATGWSFDFTIAPSATDVPTPTPATQQVTSQQPTIRWDDLTPGAQYTITEGAEDGWQSGAVVCSSPGEAQANSFVAQPGQVVTCAASNTQLARVTVVKQAAPANDTPFAFTATGLGAEGSDAAFDLRDPGSPSATFADVVPGQTHTIAEALTPAQQAAGWVLTDLTCVDALDDTEVGEGSGAAVAVTTRPGSDITCTFTNTQLASVSVTKSVTPATATGWSVGFTISPVPAGQPATRTATAAAPTVTWTGLAPGTEYSVSEAAMPGFVPGVLGCGSGGGTFTPTPGQAVACAVTNTQLASVAVTKSVIPTTASGWSVGFTISPVPAGETATKTATPAAPTVGWSGLVPGTQYTVSEGDMPGFVAGILTCGSGGGSFTPAPGQLVACSVTNTAEAVVSPDEDVDSGGSVVGGTEDEEQVAHTGADALPLAAVALWSVLLGGALLLASRRRRRA